MLFLLFSIACSGVAPEPPPPPEVTPEDDIIETPAQPEPAAEAARYQGEQWIQASKLLFRDAPDSSANVLGELTINASVKVLKYDKGWCQIETPKSEASWVNCLYLGPTEVTPEALRSKLGSEKDIEKRLSLLQRIASLEPENPKTLIRLAIAYQEAGQSIPHDKMMASFGEPSGLFATWFKPHADRAATITAEIQNAKSDTKLIQAWAKASFLCGAITPMLEEWYMPQEDDYTAYLPPSFEKTLLKHTPWAALNLYAEGTVMVMEVQGDMWLESAQKTSGALDEQFFQLLILSYDGLSTQNWATWMDRDWDYGGASPFGNADRLHLKILQQTDLLLKNPNAPKTVGNIRASVIEDMTKAKDADAFPFRASFEERQVAAHEILQQITLTSEERSHIEKVYGSPTR